MIAITEVQGHPKNIPDPQRETTVGVSDILKAPKETQDLVKEPKRLLNIIIITKTMPDTKKPIPQSKNKMWDHHIALYHPADKQSLQKEKQDHLNGTKNIHMHLSRNKSHTEEATNLLQELNPKSENTQHHQCDTHNCIVDIPILIPDLQSKMPDQETNNITPKRIVSNSKLKLVIWGNPKLLLQIVLKIILDMIHIIQDHQDTIPDLQIITRTLQGDILIPSQEQPPLPEWMKVLENIPIKIIATTGMSEWLLDVFWRHLLTIFYFF